MSRRAIPAVLLVPLLVVAIVVSSSACGTIANFNEGRSGMVAPTTNPGKPPTPFGGVQWDIERAIQSKVPIEDKAIQSPLWLVELGLSACLDTATLPIVFSINLRRAWERAIYERSGPHRVTVTEIEAVPSDSKTAVESNGRMPD
jgi:uncharacterized protein YceK